MGKYFRRRCISRREGTIKIVFLARSLETGGAERQMAALARGLKRSGHDVTVLTLYPGGALENDIEGTGVTLVTLNKKGRWEILRFFYRLVKAVRHARPDILHSYMTTQNILAVMLKPFYGNMKVVWGILSSNMDLSNYDRLTGTAFRLERLMSSAPDFIIVNSHTGRDVMLSKGYPGNKMVAIANGIDTKRFYVDDKARGAMREEFGVRADEMVIGLAGRLDPMKDHPNFLKAAAILLKENKNLRFICVGGGPEKYAEKMRGVAETLGISGRVTWAGERKDMQSIYNAFDIAVSSSSYGEGHPNVIGEAMACGLPCVVTDVGDLAAIVGDTGIVAPPNDPEKFAECIAEMIKRVDENKSALSLAARDRIISEFGMDSMTNRTVETFLKLL